MKSTSIKIQVAWVMLLLTSYVTRAQNQLIVTLTNGQTDAFNVSDIRSVKFVNNTMNLMENNGSQSSWNIDDVSRRLWQPGYFCYSFWFISFTFGYFF